MEEESAALLAALTDSLDGMVDAEGGGLSVFPALEEEPDSDQDSLPLDQDFSPAPDSEDPSLIKPRLERCVFRLSRSVFEPGAERAHIKVTVRLCVAGNLMD
uniref:Uncharacterized protein n=1 Tax=Knipowitschia caucasica TaxID=637954 RepID=A0AAV2MN94_KNICA